MASKLFDSITQTDVATLTYRTTNGFNECLFLAANEPSLGLYRIQEHVQNSVPKVVEQRQQLQQMCERVEGASFDLEYDTSAVKEMGSVTQFTGLSAIIERAIHLKRQLEERERWAVSHPPQSVEPSSTPAPPVRNYGTIKPVISSTDSSAIVDDLKPKSFV